jgi:hypothetical protein
MLTRTMYSLHIPTAQESLLTSLPISKAQPYGGGYVWRLHVDMSATATMALPTKRETAWQERAFTQCPPPHHHHHTTATGDQ